MSSTILINPQYDRLVQRHGLHDFERVMHWTGGRTVGRHAKRDIERIEIEEDGQRVCLYLKREWQTYLKDRFRSWIEGLGWGTKSRREWHVLRAMTEAKVGCAEPVVFVERSGFRPQGYLVVREIANASLLAPFLNERRSFMTVQQRRRLAAHLGYEVARLHAAGIDHPDLYSKHVLMSNGEVDELPRVWFLDMQRSSTRHAVSQQRRVRDLAALDATVPPHLASRSDRLSFLRSYLSACSLALQPRQIVPAIRHRSGKLQTRCRIRAMREAQ